MGRNIKEGLNYFPMDVDFFEDDKVQYVSARFGLKGDAIIARLLCKIYRNGYFIEFNDDVALLFCRSVGDISSIGLVKEVVNELVKRGFFDESLFNSLGLLTSRGIQKRYEKICTDAKRKDWKIDEKIDLLQNKSVKTPEEIIKTPEEITQRKVKKSKEKNSIIPAIAGDINSDGKKEYSSIEKTKDAIFNFIKTKPDFIDPYVDFWNLFAEVKSLSKVSKINQARKRKFSVRIKENDFDFAEILRKAGKSDFLINGGKWFGFDWIIENDSNYLKVLEGNYDNKDYAKTDVEISKREMVI